MNTSKAEYRFSIVIPCYNEADFIAMTLESLAVQDTLAKYEVIVVDNNCTDDTVRIAHKHGARIVSEIRPGVCAARQAGTDAATGEIVISTDADTIFSPHWLSTIDADFTRDPKLIAIGGPCRYFDGPWWGKVYTHFLFSGSYIYCLIVGHPFYFTATNIAFKKSSWTGYNLTIMQGGDELDLLHRLRRQGKVRFNNRNPTYTSGRRLSNGLFYNIFVTFLFYYLGAYYLDKLFKRSIIGSAPAFRKTAQNTASRKLRQRQITAPILISSGLLSIAPLRLFISDNLKDITAVISKIFVK
jgi:glycosyltransferase involved in cell wall biosynthesis